MKKLFTLFVILALTISVFAQSPQKMSYQAVIRDAGSALITSHAVGMRISILQGSVNGTAVYTETQTPTTNANGLVSIEIGGGAGFDAINWAAGSYFIKTETDPTGGTNYTITGVSQILSVPYALYSKTAKTANYNDLINKPVLFDGAWTSLTGKPSLATVATSGSYNDLINKPTLFDGTWINITGKPTTLTGYGITDAMSTSHIASSITSAMITNWNTAYGWGNHSGLYKLNSYVPAWVEITGKPTFAVVATSGSYNDLSNKPTILNSPWTTSGSNIYYNLGNIGIGTSSPVTYIHAHGIPIASRGQLTLSSPSGQDIFQSFYEADIFKAYLWYDVSDQDLRLQNYTAGDLNLNPYGGNVGIGTNTPSTKLEVNGTVKATAFEGDGSNLTNITIPDNSINSQNIVNGTIQNEDIAANAIETNKIQDGSITAFDIADEPAVKEANSIWIKIPTTCSSLRSISVTAPADGRLLVIATGTLSLLKSSTTEAYWRLDLNNVPNDCSGSVPQGQTPKSASRGFIPASWTFTNDFGLPFNFQEVFTVTKGVTYNFYLNGDANGFSSDVYLFHPTIVASYFPSSL